MEKFDIFCKTLENLKIIEDYSEPYDAVTEAGLIGLYSICFEQAWKAMKAILEKYGYDHIGTSSPNMVVKTAYQSGIIKDVDGWLSALEARNNVSRSYDKNVAADIIRQTRNKFITLFTDLEKEVKKNWP